MKSITQGEILGSGWHQINSDETATGTSTAFFISPIEESVIHESIKVSTRESRLREQTRKLNEMLKNI